MSLDTITMRTTVIVIHDLWLLIHSSFCHHNKSSKSINSLTTTAIVIHWLLVSQTLFFLPDRSFRSTFNFKNWNTIFLFLRSCHLTLFSQTCSSYRNFLSLLLTFDISCYCHYHLLSFSFHFKSIFKLNKSKLVICGLSLRHV